jgi:hypothetical protein
MIFWSSGMPARIFSALDEVTMTSDSAFHLGRAVDVGERDMVGMRRAEGRELVGRAGILKAAPGVEIGQDHDLFRAQDLGGFGHELHAAKGDHFGRWPPPCAKVPANRRRNRPDPEFRALVIVREDHRIAFLAQAVDLGAQIETGKVGAGKIGGLGRHGCSSIPVIHNRAPVSCSHGARLRGAGPACQVQSGVLAPSWCFRHQW